jgi:peptidoglycan/xylan/chitin deacetylase (PgdA/CDA1 family)
MRGRLKQKIGKLWPARKKGGKLVLLYHSVGKSPWALSEKLFDLQIQWLAENCKIISLDHLLDSPVDENELQVALTFDDGYQSLYTTVAPSLIKKNAVATVYLNTGWIGENAASQKKSDVSLGHYPDERFLSWQEVKSLYSAGWVIGSHGVNHYNLTQTGLAFARNELIESKKSIEKRLNIKCRHFAYTWGKHSRVLKNAVKQAGYLYAAGAFHGRVPSRPDFLALPRINIEKNYTLDDFINIIRGKWDYLGVLHRIRGL